MANNDAPEGARKVLISVRVTPDWAEWVDSARGEMSRDAFFRMLMIQRHQAQHDAIRTDRLARFLEANPDVSERVSTLATDLVALIPDDFGTNPNPNPATVAAVAPRMVKQRKADDR